MTNCYFSIRCAWRPTSPARLLVALAFLLALLPALAARAQAPSWQLALAPTQLAGGTSQTRATAIDAVGNVYLTGQYTKQVQFGSTVLTSLGSTDVFVACYRPASGTWAWATSGGGTDDDAGFGIATDGTRVYVTGSFTSNRSVSFAGQALAGAGSRDVFVAAYAAGTGASAWATSGGGPDFDSGYGIATDGTRVYVTGYFASNTNANFAGQVLAGAGSTDAFVAAYATGTGAGVWATSGGGTGGDAGSGIATDGTRVCVTGYFASNTSARFAEQALAGAGRSDAFVAAYAAGTGAGRGAVSGGSSGSDYGLGIAVGSAGSVWVSGSVAPPATFGATTLAGSNTQLAFLGRVHAPIAMATVPGGAAAGLVLYPNPAADPHAPPKDQPPPPSPHPPTPPRHQTHGPAALSRYAATAVLSNALGRVACTQQLPASGGAVRTLAVAGLAPGLYVLRLHTPAGELSSKLMIE